MKHRCVHVVTPSRSQGSVMVNIRSVHQKLFGSYEFMDRVLSSELVVVGNIFTTFYKKLTLAEVCLIFSKGDSLSCNF